MDSLDQSLTFEYEHKGTTYKFRRPTVKQSMRIDVLAAQYRGGMPINSLTYSLGLSDVVATLNVLCYSPETVEKKPQGGFDFSDLESEDVYEIYAKVTDWTNSFRKKVGG